MKTRALKHKQPLRETAFTQHCHCKLKRGNMRHRSRQRAANRGKGGRRDEGKRYAVFNEVEEGRDREPTDKYTFICLAVHLSFRKSLEDAQ